MKTLPRLFVFALLLATGACLECEVCSGPSQNCTGGKQQCDANEDTCAIISVKNTLEDIMMQTFIKDCETSESCMTPGKSLSVGKGRTIQMYYTCCIKDFCAMEQPRLRIVQNATNGIRCPACLSTNGSCPTEIIDCTGDEKYCFEMVSATQVDGKSADVTMKGCATRNICRAIEEGWASPIRGAGLSLKHGSCTPRASGGSQTAGLLFPTFAGLLLMKIIL